MKSIHITIVSFLIISFLTSCSFNNYQGHAKRYDKSKINGFNISYIDSTNQIIYSNYKNGLKHGKEMIINNNGFIAQEGQYKKGKKHGVFLTYFSNGHLGSKAKYKNGVLLKQVLYNTSW